MCFTPLASILTATTEFTVSGFLSFTIKDKKLRPIPIFIFLLGFYQLTEFMLCMVENTVLWARIGFATYTFIPAVLYHCLYNLSGRTIRKEIYAIPALFAAMALFHPDFILSSGCNLLHVSVHSLIFNQSKFWMFLYLAYYIVFSGLGFFTFTKSISRRFQKNVLSTRLKFGIVLMPLAILFGQIYFLVSALTRANPDTVWIMSSILIACIAITAIALSCIPLVRNTPQFIWSMQCIITSGIGIVLILYVLFPQFAYDFSSIFCQFALLYTLAAVLLVKGVQSKHL